MVDFAQFIRAASAYLSTLFLERTSVSMAKRILALSLALIMMMSFLTACGGGTTNNLWMIWTLVFLGLILAAAVAEIVYRFKKSAKA